MTPDSAYDRHLRTVGAASGVGTVIFTALAVPTIVDQAGSLNPLFYLPVTLLYCLLPIAMIPVARVGRASSITRLARAHTVVSFALLVGWVPAMTAPALPDGVAPWVLNIITVSTATAVLGFGSRVAWALTLAYPVLGVLLRYVVLDDGWSIPVQDGVSMLTFGSVIAVLLHLALGLGRRQDAELALAEVEARGAAETQSRSRARSRFGALVHDDVITTLLAAARADQRDDAVERSARGAIRRIDTFATDDARSAVTAADLEVELRTAASEVADGVQIVGSLTGFRGRIPFETAIAIAGAVGEAARNSVRHAAVDGRALRLGLALHGTRTGIAAEFADDGRGFDSAAVAPERLGIRSSILERVSAVEGATARIDSSPGGGTRVHLEWSPSSTRPRASASEPRPAARVADDAPDSTRVTR